ncbi:killer suppression protein [Candidatus Nitrosymbiomonas proteolyticus]|uniref:Killer suppression protein n=1 Tax=Candidatus Nitrosymbiomonas proteolyticus TaxID=2608984 RepID=A0A809S8V2_9BACT|nr:killer suppression protein [Candidatus Nitrosymbiomonas proteolyticus]GIK31593.1 MAG: hypothetical protein BroJett009_05850 [Armatimonadota bacterium]
MDISFATDRLERDMNDHASMVRAYGAERAKALQKRLADLDAVQVLEEMRLLAGRCEELVGDRKGQLSVRLNANYRLIFQPADEPPALKDDGGIDWNQVRSIQILEVIDYH